MTGRVLVVKSGGREALPEWEAAFAKAAPHLEVRWWDDPSLAPEQVDYAFVWQPGAGRLAGLPNLRLICSAGAGVDHILQDPDWPRHVPLVRMGSEEAVQRMAEYVVFAALALLRDLPRIQRAQQSRQWDKFDSNRTAPQTRVGIMGLGNMGLGAARMLRAVGFPVTGWSRTPKALDGIETYDGEAGLAPFLARCDILVCLLPATPEVAGIIGAKLLARLPQGAGIINAGRGVHVVLPDLIAALDEGHISGAVLDVFETEPLPQSHPVWAHPRILVTSHLASDASRPARAAYVAAAIAAFERGDTPPNLFDPVRGY